MQIGLSERNITHFGTGSYIELNFGAELRGGIRILILWWIIIVFSAGVIMFIKEELS